MAVDFPIPAPLLLAPAFLAAVVVLGILAWRGIEGMRQRAYDRRAGQEVLRWVVRVDPHAVRDREATRRLIAGLHPGIRRGFSQWAVGWPEVSLEIAWVEGRARWEILAPSQLNRVVEAAIRSAYPDADVAREHADPRPPPSLSLALVGSGPEAAASSPAAPPVTSSVVELLARLPEWREARWTIRLRPQPLHHGREPDGGAGLGAAVVATLLNQPLRRTMQRNGQDGVPRSLRFAAAVTLDAWFDLGLARAWLFDGMSLVGLLRANGWRVRGHIGGVPRAFSLEAGAVAQLWSLPGRDDENRSIDVLHSRQLRAPSRLFGSGRPIGRDGDRAVQLAPDVFLRHAAFIGGTGSGKSTQLVSLAADDLTAGRGFTFLDPHGDAVARLVDAVPPQHLERIHLIELAERDVPRGFNFLELDGADPELVAVQFVDTLYDLYAKYSGPKQTHYLRMALLTLLSRPPEPEGPWTVVDLYQLLVNRDVRRRFTAELGDEVLRDFWSHEWPLDSPRAREQSVEAVLNKLGGFIAYPTIRDIVAARYSTIRPRAVMDGAEVLLVDLSRVGRDHARLFGSMLVARYYIDALARQGTPAAGRVPHQLYVDEVHNFDTSSLRGILTETRKFGLGLTVATQYVRRLQPELATALHSNVVTVGLLQPAPEDVADLADAFAPLTPRDLRNLPRFRMALRTEVDGERVVMTPDVLAEPAPLGSAQVVRRSSDQRDGRWRP